MKVIKRKEINPYTVSDKVRFRNVDRTLDLYVRTTATALMVNLRASQERLSQVTDQSDPEAKTAAARFFAESIFGKDAEKLMAFYGDPMAVIAALGIYFDQRLKFKITKAQKR